MAGDSLSLRSVLASQRLPANAPAFRPAVPENLVQPGALLLAPQPNGAPPILAGQNPPRRIFSESTRKALGEHLVSSYVLPQSAGKNFRAALKAPFKAFWNWAFRKNTASPASEVSAGASALSSGAKAAGRVPRLAAKIGEEFTEHADDVAAATSAHALHLTDTIGEAIGAGEHIFGLGRNLKELKDRSSDRTHLQRLQAEHEIFQDLLRQGSVNPEALHALLDDFSEPMRAKVEEILTPYKKDLDAQPNEEGFVDSRDVDFRQVNLAAELRNQLPLLEYQIHLLSSGLKSKDALWVSERSANSVRYGFGLANTGTSIAITAGSTAAHSLAAGLAHPIGVLNIAAGGFSVHRSLKAGQEAQKAATQQAALGGSIRRRVETNDEKSADLQSLLLEQKRRAEKATVREKSAEKKSQALQATDYFVRGALWIGGIVALSLAAPLVFFGLTTAALVLGGVGAGLALGAVYSKFQRDAAVANKISGLQFLQFEITNAENVEEARQNLLDAPQINDPSFRKSARHALKILDAINSTEKYESLVGPREPLPEDANPPGHSFTYSKDQLLEIATYKLSVRNSRALAAAYCNEIRSQDSRPDAPATDFLRNHLNWSDENVRLFLELLTTDSRSAEDFFCKVNKLPIPRTLE